MLKSDIEIAPVHHRLPDRIRAHALISFLALVLYRVMRMRLKAKGRDASPRAALDLLARIQKHTAHIGERTFNGTSKTTSEQLDLFDALSLPRRKRCPRATLSQLDGLKFQGSRSSMRLWGWPSAIASRVALR